MICHPKNRLGSLLVPPMGKQACGSAWSIVILLFCNCLVSLLLSGYVLQLKFQYCCAVEMNPKPFSKQSLDHFYFDFCSEHRHLAESIN